MPISIKTITWKFNDCSKVYPELPQEKIYIHGPEDLFRNFLFLFKQQVKERFIIFWLNATYRVIGFEIVSEGLLNSSLAHPREVFRDAIVAGYPIIPFINVARSKNYRSYSRQLEDLDLLQALSSSCLERW